jgi:pSer/pThr/pTyr-binding forkhead associated (FHA) protein
MQVTLVVKEGRTRTRFIELTHADTIIGRQRGCKVRIPSAEVSRRHCMLSAVDGYVTVEDLDSANGTFVNGQKVIGKQAVRPGDTLTVGPLAFVVQYELTQTAEEALNSQFPLQQLADLGGEEELEVLEEIAPTGDEEVLDAKVLEPAEADLEEPMVLEDAEVLEEEGELPVDEVMVDLDDAGPWQMPDADQLRDLLKEMDRPKRGS